jgi:hypothetical protein
MSDEPQADQPEQIEGAKLVNGTWQDADGNPLSTADLNRLRAAQHAKHEKERRERERAARQKAKDEA